MGAGTTAGSDEVKRKDGLLDSQPLLQPSHHSPLSTVSSATCPLPQVQREDGLFDGHAYSVITCLNDVAGTDVDLIKMRNPHGSGELTTGIWGDHGAGWSYTRRSAFSSLGLPFLRSLTAPLVRCLVLRPRSSDDAIMT